MNKLSDLRVRITQLVGSMSQPIDITVLLAKIRDVLEEGFLSDVPLCLSQPYSRSILCVHDKVEIMIARWTPDIQCAPHDHGESNSLIYVLSGCAKHRLYHIRSQRLQQVYEDYKKEGDVIRCSPKQVHSIGASPVLVTLHIYMPSIRDMVIYDIVDPKTFVVRGTCGAWLPIEDDKDILNIRKGHHMRGQL